MYAWSTSSGGASFEIDSVRELQDLAGMGMRERGSERAEIHTRKAHLT